MQRFLSLTFFKKFERSVLKDQQEEKELEIRKQWWKKKLLNAIVY